MAEHMAWIIPLVSTVTTVATSESTAHKQRKSQRHQRKRTRALWEQTAFPSAAEKEAATGKLGQARQSSYQSMATELASRGMGPGSGVGAKRAGGIEAGYGKAYAHLMSEMSKPRWPMPGLGGSPVGPGGVEAGSDALNEAMGYYWASQMYGGGGGGGSSFGSTYQPDWWQTRTGMEGMPYLGTY